MDGESELVDNNGNKYTLQDGNTNAYYSLRIPNIDSDLPGAIKLNEKIALENQELFEA